MNNKELIFPSHGVIVVMNIINGNQRFLLGHTAPVSTGFFVIQTILWFLFEVRKLN